MSVRNNHWYNLNSLRSYPLDETATGLSNAGTHLPSNLIEDLRLRWPRSLGQFAFISAATVTNHIVTILIEATSTLNNDLNDSTLIAGLSLPMSDFVRSQMYRLQSFVPGVGGYIAIGSGASNNYTGVFGSPNQSMLTPRAARPYRSPPVPTIRLEGSTTRLTGIVNITATAPLQIVKESRVIGGVEYDNVAVIRLSQDTANIDSTVSAASVFSRYIGPCGSRVNSKSCNNPQPILSINGVSPDCDGVLTLTFNGCATVGKVSPDNGVVLDCDKGLSTTCKGPYLPALSDGSLPSESDAVEIPPPVPPEPPIFEDVSISEVLVTSLTLPYCDTFDTGTAVGFVALYDSLFGFIADDSPAEDFCCVGPEYSTSDCCQDSQSGNSQSESAVVVFDVDSSYGTVATAAQARNNVSVFISDVQTLYRRYTTDVKIFAGQVGSKKNAGILVNYRTNEDTDLAEYWTAHLNLDNGVFGLYFFNGISLVLLGTSTVVTNLRTGDWYRLTLSVIPDSIVLTRVNLVATLDGIYDPSISVTLASSVSAGLYLPDSGMAGLTANRSKTIYSFWRIEEAV